jgi:N-acetylneuraminic acid mutarotase
MKASALLLLVSGVLGCHDRAASHPDGSSAMKADASMQGSTPNDPTPFAWMEVSPCPLPRFEAQGAVVGGRLYVMGGFISGTLTVTPNVHSYDPASDTWRQEQDLPGAETHMAVVVNGTEIWLIGGFVGNATGWMTTQAVWMQPDPASPWQQATPLPSPRAAEATVLIGNQIHAVAGLAADGTSDSAAHTVLDLTQPGAWSDAPAVPNPRNHLAGATVGGLIYAIGGRHGWDEQTGNQDTVNAFDPSTQQWTTLAPLPLARSEINASTFTSGQQIIVAGGSIDPATPSADVFVFDPATNAWLRLPSLPGPRKGAVAARIGQEIIVTTGSPDGTDPIGTTWKGCCLSP